MPSTTTRSTPPPALAAPSRRISTPSVTASARITTTLAQIQPRWVTSSHAAFSTMDTAASHPVARTRGHVAADGSHCQTV